LSDSAANPRFIETLARRGYRFLAPVEFVRKHSGPPAAVIAAAISLGGVYLELRLKQQVV